MSFAVSPRGLSLAIAVFCVFSASQRHLVHAQDTAAPVTEAPQAQPDDQAVPVDEPQAAEPAAAEPAVAEPAAAEPAPVEPAVGEATTEEATASSNDSPAEPRTLAPMTSPTPSDTPAVAPTAAPAPTPVPKNFSTSMEEARLSFNFSGADWRLVLEWLAEEAQLSLQVDRYPTGTVNFSDPSRTYSVSESMDLLNRLLLDRGFALVRRGRLLMLIDLESDNASGLISEVAELVTPDELDQRADSDIVRCVFPLGGITPEAARTEIAQLIGPAGKAVVLDSAKQVVVTETVSRLKAIRSLLDNAASAGSEVTEIVLKYRGADEILEIARPLLGLEPGMNSSADIKIATGIYGDRLYATGLASKCALLSKIVERADTPLQTPAAAEGADAGLPRLETYPISNVEPAVVIDVLQTLLAGLPDTRIASDPKSRGIIAYTRPETHQLIQQTIDKLEGRGSSFEVIQLRRLEPSQALLTINKFFGVSAEASGDGPTVDGDPVTKRLWIRGTPQQIQLVRDLIDQLEGADAMGPLGDRVRILPYTGREAEQALEQLQTLWDVTGRKNKIRMVTPASGAAAASRNDSANGISFPQRRVGGERSVDEPMNAPVSQPNSEAPATLESRETTTFQDARRASTQAYQFVKQVGEAAAAGVVEDPNASEKPNADGTRVEIPGKGGDIVISMTPAGMIIASDDPEALADFEEMMRTLTDQTSVGGSQPTVFWLKYAKAQEAADLATKILSGGESSSSFSSTGGGSLLGELGGGMLGGLLGFGGGGGSGDESAGPVLTTTGSVSIIPDARLNALIVQANAIDMRMVEMVLEVIDREESPEDVQTTSKPQLIPVIYQDANEIATIIKGVYKERTGEAGGGQQRQPSPEDFINALRGGGGRGGRGGGGNENSGSKPTPINIAVDVRSNSLIVSAPPQDFEDIRALVEAIDAGGMQSEETVQIVSLGGNLKADVVQKALESVLGQKTQTTSSSPSSSSQPSSSQPAPSSGGTSQDDINRRIEFFRSLRSGGASPFGGGGSPFGGGGAPSSFGGGRSGFGGGGFGGGDSGRGGGDSGRGGGGRGR